MSTRLRIFVTFWPCCFTKELFLNPCTQDDTLAINRAEHGKFKQGREKYAEIVRGKMDGICLMNIFRVRKIKGNSTLGLRSQAR